MTFANKQGNQLQSTTANQHSKKGQGHQDFEKAEDVPTVPEDGVENSDRRDTSAEEQTTHLLCAAISLSVTPSP